MDMDAESIVGGPGSSDDAKTFHKPKSDKSSCLFLEGLSKHRPYKKNLTGSSGPPPQNSFCVPRST